MGPIHLAVGLNNRALFWDLSISHYDRIHFERDYLATIDSMRLNEKYVSTLFDGKLQLHSVTMSFELIIKVKMILLIYLYYLFYTQIKSDEALINNEKDTKMFPDSNSHSRITCHALCADFLIYGNDVSQLD